MANYGGLYRKLLDKVLGIETILSKNTVTIDDEQDYGPPFRKDPLLRFNTLPHHKALDKMRDAIVIAKIEDGTITADTALYDIHFDVGRFPVDQPTERIEVAGYDPQYSDGVVPEQIIEPREAREITNWTTGTIQEGDWFTDLGSQFLITKVEPNMLHIRRIN